MSETWHRIDIFLPSVSGVGAFQAESSLVTKEWEVGWTAAQTENYTRRITPYHFRRTA